jgi:mycothiol S-conjugate amidase
MSQKRTLLGVFAHPDDETFGPGGTLARYAAEGANVHVIIATDGIAGSVEDPEHLKTHATLAQRRSQELSNAPDNDHPDALIQQPIERLVDELLGYIHRMQPQVIITHDPFGGYGHPDHIHVCKAVTAAFHIAAGQAGSNAENGYRGPQKLYYPSFDKRILKLMVRVLPYMGKDPTAFGRNKDINLVDISTWETPIHARIDIEPYLSTKFAASRAHVSQFSGGPAYVRVLPKFLQRRFLIQETFTRAFPAPNGRVERDLFEGVR